MEEDVEVIFESWLLKLTGLETRSTFRLSSHWKRRYFILLRQHESASLLYYGSKPTNLNDTPRGIVVLEPYYTVEKRYNVRGQNFVISLTTPTKRMVVAVDDERIFHLFAFFLQVQIKLKEEVEEECVVVRPDNSDDQRRIGARGNLCLLHLSPWGVTIALQLSKCVLVQWPLTCIRHYESTGRGQFVITVGRRATMGVGRYVFSTRLGHDAVLYDRLDHYVADAAGLRYSQPDNLSQSSVTEVENLHNLTYVQANGQFSNHLRKISRDIYDSLWQHLGSTRLKASSPDLVSDSPHARQRGFSRSGSSATLDGSPSLPSTPRQPVRRKFSQQTVSTSSSVTSPVDFSSLPRNFSRSLSAGAARRKRPTVPIDQISSEYLHPPSLYGVGDDSNLKSRDSPPQAAVSPESDVAIGDKEIGASVDSKPPTGPKAIHGSGSGEASSSVLPGAAASAAVHMRSSSRPRLQRLQSRSCEDLIAYMDMATSPKHGNEYVYDKDTFVMSNSAQVASPAAMNSSLSPNGAGGDIYSYASQDEAEATRAAAQKLAHRRLANNGSTTNGGGMGTPLHALPTGFIHQPLVRQTSLKKALSNPSLLEGDQGSGPVRSTTACSRLPAGWMPGASGPHGQHYPHHQTAQHLSVIPSVQRPPLPKQNGAGFPPMSPVDSRMGGSPITTSRSSPKRPQGIKVTSKTKVFRRPSADHSPTKGDLGGMGPELQRQQSRDEVKGSQGVPRDNGNTRLESVSSGYASPGTPEQDMRETHC